MPFVAEHYLLVFGGPLGTQDEWTMSLRLSAFTAQDDPGLEQSVLEGLAAKMATKFATTPSPMSNAAKLAWMKYNRVDTEGRYVRQTTNVFDLATPASGNQAAKYPPQVSLVATLTTNVNRGLASKGRIYLPSPSYTLIAADQAISTASALEAATWVADLINIINLHEGMGFVIVASKVRAGDTHLVTGVNVGTALDTMRSRRNKLVENRQAAEVTSSGAAGGGGDF